MKTEQELRTEIRRQRERARELSGFWSSELAAATYALEWVLGKRPAPPSADLGIPSSVHGRIAESLLKAVKREALVPERGRGRPKSSRRMPAGRK